MEELFVEFTELRFICEDYLHNKLKKKLLNKETHIKKIPQIRWNIKFIHKAMDKINLHKIIHKCEPFKPTNITTKPSIIFTHKTNIRSKLLNFKETINNIKGTDWTETNGSEFNVKFTCMCHKLKDDSINKLGHLQTGNINILGNEQVINILQKGTKFIDS